MAHEILARVIRDGSRSPEEAEREAERLFDTEGPRLAAALFAYGGESVKRNARMGTARAAKALMGALKAAGLSVVAVEKETEKKALGATLLGRPDLVAGSPAVIVDLKWHDGRHWRESLRDGAAWQLACYSFLHHSGGGFPEVAFFLIDTQRLLTNRDGLFPGASIEDGARPRETWEGLAAAYAERWSELDTGTVKAPGERDGKGKLQPASDSLVEGILRLAPPCGFCAFGLLCGHGLEG